MTGKGSSVAHDSNIVRYMSWLKHAGIAHANDYATLWNWSVRDPEAFWSSIVAFHSIGLPGGESPVLASREMPGARWFPNARVNYAEQVFRMANDSHPAMITHGEDGTDGVWSWQRLQHETAAFAHFLKTQGVVAGDCVVGYLPNIAETVVAFLAASSLGATWSACNLDVAVAGVLSRLQALHPKVLVAADGSRYAGHAHERSEALQAIRQGLPTLKATVVVPRLGISLEPAPGQWTWRDAIAQSAPLTFVELPFDHPLWVLFSSGTTGAPKGLVHGHGGIVLEQLKFLGLHIDLRRGDRFFWYCSTSWVMWNIQVSGLLLGATIVLYDGSPVHPDAGALWRIADADDIDILGVSPAYLQASEKDKVKPRVGRSLRKLRSVGCTGSPIPQAAYDWVEAELGPHVPLNSISGGTDVASAFVGGCPILPVYPGENSARCLGVAAEAWSETGHPLVNEVGELVVTLPMPSMPLRFWNDTDGRRYREAYFEMFPGVWRHSDWVTLTPRGSVVVHGRSDATLNRQGVRLGSAEIYQAVEALPEIREALVVGVELPGGNYWMPLFVHLNEGSCIDAALKARIADAIRRSASPRHVPDEVIAVSGIPHTLTGKKLEVPIKRILLGAEVAAVINPNAVDRPELLRQFSELAISRRALS